MYLPEDDRTRKDAPLFRGLLGYFPAALFEVAQHSLESDRKHNPGNPNGPNWARGKSSDHEDCIVRHVIDAGPRRSWVAKLPDWLLAVLPGSNARDARRYHLRCLAWRALALLQEDCEATGSAPGASSTFPASAGPVLEHPAQTMARDALLAEEIRNALAKSNDLGPSVARVQAMKLVRARLGCTLKGAKLWLDKHVPAKGAA